MNRLAQQIRHLRADVYQSFPAPVRALHAIARISAHAEGRRRKKAYSASTITKLVDSELRKLGLKDAPSINWGAIFHTAVAQMTRKLSLDRTQREDFLADVVSDMIMGQSITTVRDTGPWKQTVSQQLEEWIKAGWDDNRIKATLTKFVKDKTYNIYRRWVKMNEGADVSFEQGRPGDSQLHSDSLFEELFTMDGLSSAQMGTYHSIMRQNPEVKNLVQKIEKVLNRKSDDMGLIWHTLLTPTHP